MVIPYSDDKNVSKFDRAKSYFKVGQRSRHVPSQRSNAFATFRKQSTEHQWITLDGRSVVSSFDHLDSSKSLQSVLNRKGTIANALARSLKRGFGTPSAPYRSSRWLGWCMLFMFFINAGIFFFLFLNRNNHIQCTVELDKIPKNSMEQIYYTVTGAQCGNPSLTRLGGDKIYVYYGITNFKYFSHSLFKQYSKKQLSGKIFNDPADVSECYPYDIIKINGRDKILHPCGAYLWHMFYERFRFSNKDPRYSFLEYLELDESKELLSHRQEFMNVKNPSKEDRQASDSGNFFWLHLSNLFVRESKMVHGLGKQTMSLTHKQNSILNQLNDSLNPRVSGEGVENGHVIQWLSPPPFPTFSKLYGALKGPLDLPLYVTVAKPFEVPNYPGKNYLTFVSNARGWPVGNFGYVEAVSAFLAALSLVVACLMLLPSGDSPNSFVNLM